MQLLSEKSEFVFGVRGGRSQDPDGGFGDAEPLQHLLVIFLFGNVMNAQTGERLIGSDRIVFEQPYFRRPTLPIDFCRLHRAEGYEAAENYNASRRLQSVVDHQPSAHIAEGPKRRASQEGQNDQDDQQRSSNALPA